MALIDRKMPIITDVNDSPSVEGDTIHPNGSLMCSQYNSLIDNELTDLQTSIDSIPSTTDDLPEGTTNKYFSTSLCRTSISATTGTSGITYNNTTGVFDFSNIVSGGGGGISDLTGFTTDNLVEGTTNKYYSSTLLNTDFDTRLATKTTDNLPEGTTNKYFSTSLARLSISVTGNGTYDNTTGVINISNSSVSIDHISLTGTVGNVDTYTIWGDNAETIAIDTFTVTNGINGVNGVNGVDGVDGINGVNGVDGKSIVATTVTDNPNNTHTVEFFTDLAKTQKVGEVILNDGVAGADGADGISPTVSVLTQAAYDALSPNYDVNTFYVING